MRTRFKRQIQRGVFKLCCALVLAVTTATGQERVGILSDLNRIRFEGLENYSREAVISGLLLTEKFRSAIHPAASREGLVRNLSETVTALLLHAGHPDAEVQAELDWLTDGIIVRVNEGPLYKPGDIEVTGVDARLAEPVKDSLRSMGVLGWSEKGRVSYDPEAMGYLESLANKAFISQGYHSAELRLSLAPDPESLKVTLKVDVVELRRRTRLKGIDWDGTFRSSKKAIQEAIGVTEGMVIEGDLVAAIHQALERVANFPVYQARLTGDPETEDLQLQLYLEEDEFSTVLGQPRSEKELAFDRAAKWVGEWEAKEHDIEILANTPGGSRMRLVLSGPDWSFQLQRKAAEGVWEDWIAVLVSSAYIGLYDYDREVKVGFRPRTAGFRTFFDVTHDASPGSEAKNRNGFLMGSGFEGGEDSVMKVEVSVSPVAIRDLAGEFHKVGDGMFEGPEGVRASIDLETGRPIRIWASELKGWQAEIATRLAAKEELDRRVVETTREFKESSNLGDLIETLTGILRSSDPGGFGPFLQVAKPYLAPLNELSSLLKLADWTFWEPLSEFLTGLSGPDNLLLPPPSLIGAQGGLPMVEAQAMSSIAYTVMGQINDLFPAGTWPALLASEALYVFLGETDRFGETINEVLNGFDSGPLAHWIIVSYLSSRGVPASSIVANRGMTRLSLGRVHQEVRVLTQGKEAFPLALRTLVKDLEQFPVPQIASLAQGKLGPEIALIQTLRQHPTDPENEKLTDPVVDGLTDYLVERWLPRIEESLSNARFARFTPEGRAFTAGEEVWIRRYRPLGGEEKPPVPYQMYIAQATINGRTVERSLPEIEVEPGANLKGSVLVDLLSTHSGSDVFPVAATWTWAEQPEKAVQEIHGSLAPGVTRFEIPIDLNAPEESGTYYLIYMAGRSETSAQLLAGSGAAPQPEPEQWADGNEVARWSMEQCETAISKGFVDSHPAACLRVKIRTTEDRDKTVER